MRSKSPSERGRGPGSGPRPLDAYRQATLATIAFLGLLAALAIRIAHDHGQRPPAAAPDPVALERRAAAYPDDFTAQLEWGVSLQRAGRLDEAVSVLSRARQLNPDDPRPYAWLGMVSLAQHKASQARTYLTAAIQKDPTDQNALTVLADLDFRQGNRRSAIADYERLTALAPADARAFQRLGTLYGADGQSARAFGALAKAAQLAPEDPDIAELLAKMALHLGRPGDAETALRRAAAHQPERAETLALLAKAEMRQDTSTGGLARAEADVDRSLQLGATADGYSTRAQIRQAEQRPTEAIEDLKAALKSFPSSPDLYLLLSQCYATAGRPSDARAASAAYSKLMSAANRS